MTDFPPEKYYEACITYHLVNEFQQRLDQVLYPISISQIEEHFRGYDFEYRLSEKSFFVQYKRPIACQSGIYSWNIDKDQLQIINAHDYAFKTYYALPAFFDVFDWYQGIEKTYFVDAPRLARYLHDFKGEKSALVHSDSQVLRNWEYILNSFSRIQNSITALHEHKALTVADIIHYTSSLSDESRAYTLGYIIRED